MMAAGNAALDVLGIGNAIVDVIAEVDEALVQRLGMAKGTMALVDRARSADILAALPGHTVRSGGGSAANTCVAAAMLGARAGFLGKVAEDQLGHDFASDMQRVGVHFPTARLQAGEPGYAPTATSVILVTPDGQRTMNTFLGACVAFGEGDVEQAAVESAAVTYLEGYLFDPPAAQAAFRRAAAIARAAGRQVALSLSDPFCVGRHREAFRDLLGSCDIVFANEAEALSLFEVSDVREAARALGKAVPLAALTRSEHGSLVIKGEHVVAVRAEPTRVVDTTGAGDAYAAGFLAAHVRGLPLAERGRWGSVAAAEVIGHVGARPVADLRELVAA
ncbi:adenosine kinase [Roseomonas sp. CCTCC AB2023176]|uniref:adenosine kinase n=1 Tax=Roseomonas sp. CCTCC AB2023176 TaxID=3342640 RepID=UPI0035E13723